MKTSLKRLIPALLVASVVVLGACSKPQQAIVGKWQKDTGAWSEYYADGTAQISDARGGKIAAKYSFLEDGRLKLDVSMFGISSIMTYRVAFQGDTLTFTDEKGASEVYRRAPR